MRWLDHPRTLALLVAGAFFMEFLDGTVIATALPQMARSFGVQPVDLGIGLSAYLLTLAVLLPASGFMAERFGARSVFCSAITIFTLASLAGAFSQGVWSFTAARVLQGAGGAMMVPVGRLVVLRTTRKQDLMQAIATLTWPALTAPILAPPLGGLITTYASWHWIFLINLPLGAAAGLLAWRIVPQLEGATRRVFDWRGFVLTGLAVLNLMTAAEALGRETVDWPLTAAALLASLGLGAWAIRHAQRHLEPLLDLSGVAVPTFAVSLFGGSLFRIAVSAVPFLLPLMFQVGFGLDAFHSGLLVLALFAGNMAIKPATTPIIRAFGFRSVMIVNAVLLSATIALCGLLRPGTPLPLLLALLCASGMARSMGLTAISTIAFADIPQSRMNGANVLFNMLQQMSLGLGIAAGGLALRLAEAFRPAGAGAAMLPDFSAAFGLTALVALASLVDVVALPAGAGAQVARG